MPSEIKLLIDEDVHLALAEALRRRGHDKAQAMRLPTYDKSRIIACAEQHPQHLGLPRGCVEEIWQLVSDLAIKLVVRVNAAMAKL